MKQLSLRTYALVVAALLVIPVLAFAAEFRTGDQVSLSSDETMIGDLYMAGGSVVSAGPVRGDLIGAGGNILVSGPVTSDVTVAGGAITILGTIGDDLRVTGGNVTIHSEISGDVLIAGGQITLGGSRVGGDVAIGGGSVRVDSAVGGKILIAGGDVYLNGKVAGNVDIYAEKLTLGPKANIAGNLTYRATKEAILEEGAVVRGTTKFEESPDVRGNVAKGLLAFFTLAYIAKVLMMFVCALILAYIFTRYALDLVARADAEPLKQLGRGILFVILTPILSVVLLFTVIGIPFGVIGILAFIAAMIFGSIITPIVVGSIVHKWIWKPSALEVSWKTILLGTAVYFVVGLVPFIGGLLCFAAMLVSLGATIALKADALKQWR